MSYVKLTSTLYFGKHPQLVKPIGISVIDHYVSLVEAHEVPDNDGIRALFHEFPIKDRGAPTLDRLAHIVKFIRNLDGVVYLFCKGGHGRSGTVASAVYGKMNGLNGRQAMAHIRKEWCTQRDMSLLRPKIVKLGAPQTAVQNRTVKSFLG